MIKKTYAILLTLSLITALPAFGMENTTYPCDLCQEGKSQLNQQSKYKGSIECVHIFCQECKKHIDNFNLVWQEPIDNKVWWQCKYCSYFCNQKEKQCWRITNSTENTRHVLKIPNAYAAALKRIYPDRVLLNITDATQFPKQKPTLTTLIIGATCIASVICYSAYKAYTWYIS